MTMRKKVHSTAYLSKMLFSIDPQLTMTLSRHGTVKFTVIYVPTAPCETTAQAIFRITDQQITPRNERHKAADDQDKDGNTTAGPRVKGG